VSLLRDIRAAQQILVEVADAAPATTTDAPQLDAFLDGLKVAWCSTGEIRPTARPKSSKQRYRVDRRAIRTPFPG
jgi:hypothetical protein